MKCTVQFALMLALRTFLAVSLGATASADPVKAAKSQVFPGMPQGTVRVELGAALMDVSLNAGGFLPLEVRVENPLPESARITLEGFISASHRHFSYSTETNFMAAPGKSTRMIFLPKPFWGNATANITLRGGDFAGAAGADRRKYFQSRFTGSLPTQPVLCLGENAHLLAQEMRNALGTKEAHQPRLDFLSKRFEEKTYTTSRELACAFASPAELAPDIRALANFSGIWLTASDWNGSSPELRTTVRDWVRAGGRLFLEAPETEPAAELPPGNISRLGLGQIHRVEKLTQHNLGSFRENVRSLDAAPSPVVEADYTRWPSENFAPFQTHVPLMIGLLLGFVLCILPINLLWLAPANKRHRLFITLPGIALLAAGALLAWILVREGCGGLGIRNGLLLLSPGEARAPFFQEQISRTGIISLSGFEIPEDATFEMVQTNAPRSFLARSGTRATGSWFESRRTQSQVLRRWISSNAGVVLAPSTAEAAKTGPSLISSASYSMGPVFYAAPDGGYWKAEALHPGVLTTLTLSSRTEFEAWFSKAVSEPSSNLKARMRETMDRRNWFFATASKAPGVWIDTHPEVRWERNELLCVGPVQKEVQP